MATPPEHSFHCRLYISSRGKMSLRLPAESGPVKIARFQPLDYDELMDPAFHRLLAAFESINPAPARLTRARAMRA